MNKKFYEKPETKELLMVSEGMICASGTGDSGGLGDGSDFDSDR